MNTYFLLLAASQLTLENIGNATASLTASISGSFETSGDSSLTGSELTLPSPEGILTNITNSISGSLESVGNSILTTLVEKKQNLNDALENFDSKKLFLKGVGQIGSAINATHSGLDYAGSKLKVFGAMDNIAHGFVKLPNQIGVLTGQLPSE